MTVQVGELTFAPSRIEWLDDEYRRKYQGQWHLLVTRKQAASIIGVDAKNMAAMKDRYAGDFPTYVCRLGKYVFMVRSEVEEFGRTIAKLREQAKGAHHGVRTRRSPLTQAKSELASIERKIKSLHDREEKARAELERIRRENRDKLKVYQAKQELLRDRVTALENNHNLDQPIDT